MSGPGKSEAVGEEGTPHCGGPGLRQYHSRSPSLAASGTFVAATQSGGSWASHRGRADILPGPPHTWVEPPSTRAGRSVVSKLGFRPPDSNHGPDSVSGPSCPFLVTPRAPGLAISVPASAREAESPLGRLKYQALRNPVRFHSGRGTIFASSCPARFLRFLRDFEIPMSRVFLWPTASNEHSRNFVSCSV